MLRTTLAAVTAIGLVAGVAVGANQLRTANQPGQPDFETGPVTVTGDVTIANQPTVQAQQAGDWIISLADRRVVVWTTPEFLQAGLTYTFNWPGGESEEHEVLAVGNNGWVRVDAGEGRAKWLNTSIAVSVDASADRQRR